LAKCWSRRTQIHVGTPCTRQKGSPEAAALCLLSRMPWFMATGGLCAATADSRPARSDADGEQLTGEIVRHTQPSRPCSRKPTLNYRSSRTSWGKWTAHFGGHRCWRDDLREFVRAGWSACGGNAPTTCRRRARTHFATTIASLMASMVAAAMAASGFACSQLVSSACSDFWNSSPLPLETMEDTKELM